MLTLDPSLAFSSVDPSGSPTVTWDGVNDPARLDAARAGVLRQVDEGALGFFDLGAQDLTPIVALADALRGDARELIVLGIGGSSLGGRALRDALAPDAPVHFCDNIDPESFQRRLAALDPERSVFCVVSKSGGTVETAAQFCIVRDRLRRAFGEAGYQKRVVAITDPTHGILRTIVEQEGLRALSVPQNVGGRFSVLTAVGLLPAAFAGVDIRDFAAGAQSVATRFREDAPGENAALFSAALLHDTDRAGLRTHVVMPYCDRLRAFSDWTVQLIAESLGKAANRQGQQAHCGPLPHPAIGATDQHSQVQLFMEGPADKFVHFIAVDDLERDDVLPFPDDVPEAYAYLKGASMGALLRAEREGTALALAAHQRPSTTLHLATLNAFTLGALMMHFQLLTAAAGELYGINAFDQPGVEAGKRIAFAKIGRPGYDDALTDLDATRGARHPAFSVATR